MTKPPVESAAPAPSSPIRVPLTGRWKSGGESDAPAAQAPRPGSSPDWAAVRRQFPILATMIHGKPLVYLDSGATTQKPRGVIDAIAQYYETQNANIHRGVYQLSQDATEAYEGARRKVARFLNATEPAECIFTRGTTEGINLVASCWGRAFLKAGDEVIVSAMEHHSNIVPWQMACDAAGAVLRVIPMNDAGELDMGAYEAMLSGRTKLVAVVHVSNSLGTVNDVKTIARLAHDVGAAVLVDGAQWVAHAPTDVRDLGADFYAFSGHKLFGPTGIGVLYGRRALLDRMPPYQGGGDMIESVTFEKTTYAQLPNKFEAGTPHVAGAVGLGAAIDFVESIGFDAIEAHEKDLLAYATERVGSVPGLRIIGTAKHKAGVVSFVMEEPILSSFDLGTRLDARGIALRTGHHCCQPVMTRMNVAATTRASFALYNSRADVDALVEALMEIHAEECRKPAPRKAEDGDGARSTPADVTYPEPSADSVDAAADELAEVFDFLGDRDARNQHLLELGEKLLPMPSALKSEASRVHGCMSAVHLHGRRRPGSPDRLDFLADSDAHIVRGLVAVLEQLFAGQSAQDILAFDVEAFFARIGLDQFISTQRRNGLAGMVQRIKALASTIAAERAGTRGG